MKENSTMPSWSLAWLTTVPSFDCNISADVTIHAVTRLYVHDKWHKNYTDEVTNYIYSHGIYVYDKAKNKR